MNASTPRTPILIIKSIKNYTPYNLTLIDRSNNLYFDMKAETGVAIFLCIENPDNIIIVDDMFDCMSDQAQFAIVELDVFGHRSEDNGSLLNINLIPGAVNDGSGFVTGVPDGINVKFLMVASEGGGIVAIKPLKNKDCKEIEIHLTLSMDQKNIKNNIFKLNGSYEIIEK